MTQETKVYTQEQTFRFYTSVMHNLPTLIALLTICGSGYTHYQEFRDTSRDHTKTLAEHSQTLTEIKKQLDKHDESISAINGNVIAVQTTLREGRSDMKYIVKKLKEN